MHLSKRLFLFTFIVLSSFHSYALLIAAKEKGKKYGYINEHGEYVIPPKFDKAGAFYQGIAVVQVGKKYGVINSKGEFLVQPQYDKADLYAPEGKVSVQKAGKWGVIDQSGKIIIPLVHEYISVFANGYVVTGKYYSSKSYKMRVCPTVFNEKNEVVFQIGQPAGQDQVESLPWQDYECSQLFLPGYAEKKTNGYSQGWPIVRDNKLVLLETLEGGPSYASLKVIDLKTNKSISIQRGLELADNYYGSREGLIAIEVPEEKDKLEDLGDFAIGGFYDTASFTSEYLGTPIFNSTGLRIHPFFNGVAAAEKDGHWIFIDRDGAVINETTLSTKEYDAFPPMYFNGLIGFWKNGKAGYVDVSGKVVIPFALEEYHPFEQEITPVKQNGLYGLMRKDGSWAVPAKFEDLLLSPCPCYQ